MKIKRGSGKRSPPPQAKNKPQVSYTGFAVFGIIMLALGAFLVGGGGSPSVSESAGQTDLTPFIAFAIVAGIVAFVVYFLRKRKTTSSTPTTVGPTAASGSGVNKKRAAQIAVTVVALFVGAALFWHFVPGTVMPAWVKTLSGWQWFAIAAAVTAIVVPVVWVRGKKKSTPVAASTPTSGKSTSSKKEEKPKYTRYNVALLIVAVVTFIILLGFAGDGVFGAGIAMTHRVPTLKWYFYVPYEGLILFALAFTSVCALASMDWLAGSRAWVVGILGTWITLYFGYSRNWTAVFSAGHTVHHSLWSFGLMPDPSLHLVYVVGFLLGLWLLLGEFHAKRSVAALMTKVAFCAVVAVIVPQLSIFQ